MDHFRYRPFKLRRRLVYNFSQNVASLNWARASPEIGSFTGPDGGTLLWDLLVLLGRLVLRRGGGPPVGLKEIDKDDENRDGDDD